MQRLVVRESIVHPVGPAEVLSRILEDLKRGASGVVGAAIADRNGLPIATAFREGVHLLTITAMSALAVQSCNSVLTNLALRPLQTVTMEGEDSLVLVRVLRGGMSLLVLLEPDANIGLVRLGMERASRSVEDALAP